MKICVISAILPPYSRGGAESVAFVSMQAFSEHEVFAISAEPFGGWHSIWGRWGNLTRGKSRSLRVFRFAPINLFAIFNISKHNAIVRLLWHGLDMFNLHTYFVVRSILKREKPDLILTHNLKGLGYTVPAAIQHSKNKTHRPLWFHTVHDLGALHPTGLKIYGQENSFTQKMLLVSVYARLNAWLFGSPDVIISPSEFLLKEYQDKGFFPKSKTAIIRNPVISEIVSLSTKQPPPPFNFLYLGQMEVYKGVRLLLEVWKKFSATHKDAELVIAGDGSLKLEVEKAAKTLRNVRYVGFVDVVQKDEILSAVHYLVLPSLAYENSPTSIGESFVAGVPVIASRIGGIPELIKSGVNGFLFTPADLSALLAAMEEAVSVDYRQLQEGARKSAPIFSTEQYHDEVMKVYQSLIN
ncbi:hypothetical protein A3H10_03360 [Candidatus Uhrbacteria bacterium RIFCSPLOWO2_12_FULL_46_10]|uniref:Glycosyltransferase subfamily 4-like N-terminal domain-containing protein n=1 Tax=Candidatus Uhrbacteria bacterium RIFCSPLOWO2_01_FULL_47_25 TaxID=1802402 RepID=A0A1F7UPV1_9BACT|nr:MAG: hypothetical protein A2752_00660 [Candidatus Uhrbacteria bacterium RIFCSPHIGHO2_01_FULL_46_23]OGL69202.1 MAG: hypothetical protein A3D60_04865 [Candidatus Uhrbacteria bacterium RIFCSPHIGHO2_02_FULL_47_29]OGL75297.1 MAG: hypothetical protein A3E96_01345 [Candidatus Uhrbacteria bacterium RIFCSPHIGHO2_12_FULL_46_13]OGL80265.1 MAG: hypothetical protein A2936_02770 [Candidatus Uhrbacteria bacterium RIFCSPLOWO2_01_FULL_47_25]OGL85340.1 MAG: hypothetical protein A3I37_00675 [Candidatus Uhrbact